MSTNLEQYLLKPSNANKKLALEEMEPLIQKAKQNAKEKKPGKVIGSDELWPEIEAVFTEKYGDLAKNISMTKYFHLSNLFKELKASKGSSNGISHAEFCQPVMQIINIAEAKLSESAIPQFIRTTNEKIDSLIQWGEQHKNKEVTRSVQSLSNKLKECRDQFIREESYKYPDKVKDYRNEIKEITTSSEEAKSLSSHRGWKAAIGNTLIAFTGVGILALGVKAIHSKVTKGHVSLFFDTNTTKQVDMTYRNLNSLTI